MEVNFYQFRRFVYFDTISLLRYLVKLLVLLALCFSNNDAGAQNSEVAFSTSLTYFGEGFHYRTPQNEYLFGQIGWLLNTNRLTLRDKHTLHVDLMVTHGGTPSVNEVADLQVFSNLEAGFLYGLFEVYYEYREKHFWFKAGQQDINTDFFLSKTALLFTHSSFGIDPIATVNAVTPTYPFPGLSLAMGWEINPILTLQACVFEGVAVFPNTPFVGISTLNKGEGAIAMVEPAVHLFQKKVTLKAGGYVHTASFTNKKTGEQQMGFWGLHSLGDITLHQRESQRIRLFYQVATSTPELSEIGFYGAVGVRVEDLFYGGIEDEWGLAFGSGIINSRFPLNRQQIGIKSESVIEFSQRTHLKKYLSLQPFAQFLYIDEVGVQLTEPYVVGMRLLLDLKHTFTSKAN